MRLSPASVFALAAALLIPLPAWAWGAQGHRIVNGAAIRALPTSVPAFVRTAAAHDEVALLGPEADRIKGAGKPLDDDDDPGHYLDVMDDGTVAGIVPLDALPADRRGFNRMLAAAMPPSDQYGQGYLPYQIADGWEHIVRDFAYWRVDVVGEAKASSAADRSFFHDDRILRESLTLRDIGYWGHFVGDGSQPLHVSVHFNGWNGPHTSYPNPSGFSDSRTIHARFETALVRAVASEDVVAPRVAAPALSNDPILRQVGAYLLASERYVPAVYRLEAAGGIDAHSPEATNFVLDRLAAAAGEMRDLIVAAWTASASSAVGYPPLPVHDVESGAVVPTRGSVGLGD